MSAHLARIAFVEFDPFVPLVDVVWVLPQQHAVQQERPARDQLLEPSQAQLQVNVIYSGEVTTSVTTSARLIGTQHVYY